MIAQHSYLDDDCRMGSNLFKKYPSVFDVDSNQIKIMKIPIGEKTSDKILER